MATQPLPIEASLIDPPHRDLANKLDIRFFHPGYQHPTNVFLTLPRVDSESSNDTTVYGVHHKTALTACQIVAGNVFNAGYFSSDNAGSQRVAVPLDSLLTEGSYYFIVEGNVNYPIVPSFRDWEFPHEEVPNLWPIISYHSPTASSACTVTGVSYAIDKAHLVPQEEALWYNNNGMTVYGGDINCAENILFLGKNLHKCFDDRWFVVVPKSTTRGIQYVTHILVHNAAEIWPTYQNIIVRGLTSSSRPYLFARFAWAVLLRVKQWVNQGFPRHVIRVSVDNEKAVVEYKQELMTGIQLQGLYSGGGSKSATPAKRRFQDARDDIEDDFSGEETGGSALEEVEDDFWDTRYGEGMPERSAKRRQQASSDSIPDVKPTISEAARRDLEMSVTSLFASRSEHEPREE